jgi:hypothetical protein
MFVDEPSFHCEELVMIIYLLEALKLKVTTKFTQTCHFLLNTAQTEVRNRKRRVTNGDYMTFPPNQGAFINIPQIISMINL